MSGVDVVSGFSLVNRWLLYTSLMLSPAQFLSGIRNNCPSNLGFLAYNLFTQVQWYRSVRAKQLYALSLLLPHFNLLYAVTYLGGITSGNVPMAVIQSLATVGVMALNTASAWISWETNMPEGFGIYQFFFFGWRTLSPGWHTFLLLWQIFDTITAVSLGIAGIVIAVNMALKAPDENSVIIRYVAMPVGAAAALFVAWPLILWTELIIARNHVESPTDWIAVWLFIAQVVALVMPPTSTFLGCFRGRKQ